MGLRAYLLIDTVDGILPQEFIKILRELDKMPGVDFIDLVRGSHDILVMVDTPGKVEDIAERIRYKVWFKDMEILRAVTIFEHQRAPKKRLPKALIHHGL